MAIFKPTPKENRSTALNASKQLPRNRYAIRFIDEKHSPSKSTGNPMVTLEAEIVHPETIVSPFTGETLEVAGSKVKPIYMSLQSKKEDGSIDTKATQEAVDRYTDFMQKCGLEVPEKGIDPENPVMGFKGKVVDAILDAEEFVQRATPTPEQRAAGKPGESHRRQAAATVSRQPLANIRIDDEITQMPHTAQHAAPVHHVNFTGPT